MGEEREGARVEMIAMYIWELLRIGRVERRMRGGSGEMEMKVNGREV